MKSVFKSVICLQHILCIFILLKVACPCEVLVSKPPWPTKVFVPLRSSSVTLICNINLTNPTFEISGNLGSRLRFSDPAEEMILNSHGLFNEKLPGMLAVKLIVYNTSRNNDTQIRCRHPLFNSEDGTITTLLYEQPANISDSVRIISEDLEVINVSWTPVPTMSIPQVFTLTISHGSESEVFVANESFFAFRTPNNTQTCEIYNFFVTTTYVGATYTGDDCSEPSPVLSRMLPSLPNIERLNSSLTHNLVKRAGEIKLNVSFESGTFCEDYPVLNYTLEVNNSVSKVVRHSILPQSSNLIGNLSENREYSFRVVAANVIGINFSSDRQFYTTDLQLVTAIISDETSGAIIVQCDFISGSDARGCMVVLMEDMVTNVTVNLTRSGQCAIEMINVTFSFTNYTEVFGYDIESNGSIGDVAIDGHLNRSAAVSCMHEMIHTIESPPSAKLLPPWIIAITAVVAFIVILLSILIIALCTVFFFKRPRTGVFRPSKPSISDTQKVQPTSQDKCEEKERKEPEEIMPIPLYAIPKKAAVKDASPDLYQHIQPTNNYTKLKVDSDTKEHIYHILENTTTPQQKSELISSDPDAPELPPSFKPEPSPPPVYQDILDLQGRKAYETTRNEYASLT